ncbi:MAG: DEAD/DEAH box helicase [Chitinophagales bacterium]
MKFKDLKLNPQLLEAISYMNFVEATPVQEMAIPKILDGQDLIACAQTGTGKTAAFILPVLNYMAENNSKGNNALVIVPTRELALQIDQEIQGFAYFLGVSSIPIYGGGDGSNFDTQKRALSEGAGIIVATPGKLISHMNMGYTNFKDLNFLILDEADRMLDMGFYEDIQKIITYLPKKRQNLMFSATMPPKIRKLSKEILNDPAEINIAISKPAAGVLQAAYLAHDAQKIPLLNQLIADKPNYKSILIFSSTKKKVHDIQRALKNKDFKVESISSDLEQSEREDVLNHFRSKKTRVLVATDVISRGIDIKDINLVINFDVPDDAADYVHRVGRTARADTTGVALTLVNENDMYSFKQIEDLMEQEVMKLPLPPHIGEGPEWKVPKFKPRKGFQKSGGKGKGKFKK